MNNLLIINKETFELILEKIFTKSSFFSQEFNQNFVPNIISTIKELDSYLNTDLITLKSEDKQVVFKKSKKYNFALILITEKHFFKTENLNRIAGLLLDKFEINFENHSIWKSTLIQNLKDYTLNCIEELTIKFIESLRKNKLFSRFVYFNYNPNVLSAISYKKLKQENTSVILYNTHRDHYEKEVKDTIILQKSTIKEKDLFLEYEKKSFPPFEKKLIVSNFNNVKVDSSKKNASKYFSSNFFIDKYFLERGTMIHFLFNNVFLDEKQNKENICYPITEENETVLLYLIDLYDKSQQIFSVNKNNNTSEYLDIANYIEINVAKKDVLLIKSKVVVIKFKFLFCVIMLDIYEDKNTWSLLNTNTNFFKEMECLFKVVHNETYLTAYE